MAGRVARRVIEAVGGGNRKHANIASEAGSRTGAIPSGTLTPMLHRLVRDKHVLAIDEPPSLRATKPALYRVADSSLRFYLAIGRAAHDLSKRGRAEAAAGLVIRRWSSWSRDLAAPTARRATGAWVRPPRDRSDRLVLHWLHRLSGHRPRASLA
jgi:hypothetical protein